MLEEYKDVISLANLCEILNIGKNTAYKLLQMQVIANKKIMNKYIIPKQSVINFLESIH